MIREVRRAGSVVAHWFGRHDWVYVEGYQWDYCSICGRWYA